MPLLPLSNTSIRAEGPAVQPSPAPTSKRATCQSCSRPARVCLCASVPKEKFCTAGKVIVLQHPYEARKPLGTVSLLRLCLQDIHVLTGRKYKPSEHGILTEAIQAARDGLTPLLVLFPAPGAARLDGAHVAPGLAGRQGGVSNETELEGALHSLRLGQKGAYTLLALDGTWQQAREMWGASQAHLVPPGTAVCLAPEAIGDPSARLKMEPVRGCTTTCEAVAAALRVLEPRGAAVAGGVLDLLAAMTRAQAVWDPAVRARQSGTGGLYATGRARFGVGPGVARCAAAGGDQPPPPDVDVE
ncbi:hypothetical protein ACKKBF_B20950 [Auxenochlorella protothecoides x Auxenochlorella symbiontica]